MGYILLAILVAIASILLVIFVNDSVVEIVFSFVFGMDIILSIILPINTSMSKAEIDNTIEIYYSIKKQVEIVNSSNDKALRNAIIPDLQKRVENINKTISDNNRRRDNWWNSVFYYEEIGELEPLKIIY